MFDFELFATGMHLLMKNKDSCVCSCLVQCTIDYIPMMTMFTFCQIITTKYKDTVTWKKKNSSQPLSYVDFFYMYAHILSISIYI